MSYTSLDPMNRASLMLDLISQRQRVLGSNIANVDTPGYVRKDIDFSTYLGNMNSFIVHIISNFHQVHTCYH